MNRNRPLSDQELLDLHASVMQLALHEGTAEAFSLALRELKMHRELAARATSDWRIAKVGGRLYMLDSIGRETAVFAEGYEWEPAAHVVNMANRGRGAWLAEIEARDKAAEGELERFTPLLNLVGEIEERATHLQEKVAQAGRLIFALERKR